jgi:acyl-CoA synthetase (AMP-forming)/AMP-acid ligase II
MDPPSADRSPRQSAGRAAQAGLHRSAAPGVEMRIADAEGNTLPDGEHGEVCVRSPA